MQSPFMTAEEIMELTGRKETYCYKLIRELNKELQQKGYYTLVGRVPRQYFFERIGIADPVSDR